MYYLALAADYDGTIAQHGFVNDDTRQVLRRLKQTGRRLVLVTGRELADLRHAFSDLDIFDRVVVENGAVIYDPATKRERALAAAPPAALVQKLMQQKVEPLSVGHSIIATWHPHETAVLNAIQELGLELQITFNKGAVMVLPTGVNKASGLNAALAELDISPRNVVAVGDAENDHAFLAACGCSAAVANALPAVKGEADIRLSGDHGAGVIELADRIIREDLHLTSPSRHGILVGIDRAGEELYLEPQHVVLITGPSASGKSNFATLLTERMVEKQLEFCIIDPEGDYLDLEHAVSIGTLSTPPAAEEALKLLLQAGINTVVHTMALNLPERQRLFGKLLAPLADLQARTGRPHWILVDEAHHFFPAADKPPSSGLPEQLSTMILINVDPTTLASEVLSRVDVLLAFGSAAAEAVATFARALGLGCPAGVPILAHDEILFWSRHWGRPPLPVRVNAPQQAHSRHAGKYATGDVGEWQSFYFRGLGGDVNLRAANLVEFLRLAEEITDATWEHHLRAQDYSAWFQHVIKDEALAQEAVAIETDLSLAPRESRTRIREAVARRYVIPGAAGPRRLESTAGRIDS